MYLNSKETYNGDCDNQCHSQRNHNTSTILAVDCSSILAHVTLTLPASFHVTLAEEDAPSRRDVLVTASLLGSTDAVDNPTISFLARIIIKLNRRFHVDIYQ